MSDEELVQCPINPNHQVPRSQIDEHVKTCKFLIDPNQETQNTFSSYSEPKPSTSYQESPQEGSSHQGGRQLATLPISGSPSIPEWRSPDEPVIQPRPSTSYQESSQEGSSQQRRSQKATFPFPESTSFREWRSPKKPKIQETSPSKLKRLKPYPKPLKSREISAKSVRASSKSDLSSDKQSKKGLLEMRKETYLKILSRKRKDLKKLKIDSNSDDTSSSSTDSALSLEDTMSDNKKIILCKIGLEFKSQIPSTSQKTDSSQQAASSQQAVILQPPKLTLEKKDEKMDDESSMDLSSRLSSEPSDPLDFEMEEPSLPGDVQQEQSESVSFYAETSDGSIDLQQLNRKRKMEHEEMDTEEIVEVKMSHLLAEVTTPLEVEMEESSSSEVVPLQQSQPFSFHAALSYHSDVSDQPKMISKKKREEIDTEENIVAEASHTLAEVATELEVEMQELSLAADIPQQQLQSVSSPTKTKQDSDRSQQPMKTTKKKHEKTDKEEQKKADASPTLLEVIIQLEVELKEPSLAADLPKQQLKSVSSPTKTKQDSDRSQQPMTTTEKKQDKMDTEKERDAKTSHTLSEVTTQSEVELEEPSLAEEVPLQQSQPFSFHAALSYHSDVSDQPKMISKKKREEIDTEENIVAEASHTLAEVATQSEVELEEPSLAEEVPLQQLQPFSFHAASTSDSDVSQQPEMIIKNTHEEMDTEEKIEAKTSHTLSEVTTQLEIELEEPSLAEEVPVQQLQPFSFHAASTSDSDEMDKRNDESLQADILQQESSSLQEDNSLQEYSSLQEDSLLQGGSSLQEDNSLQEDISLQDDSMLQGGSLLQEDSSQPEESWGEETSNKLNYMHSIETGSSGPTSSFQAEQSEPVVSHDKAKHELNVSQDESRLRKRSYESTSENTDIDDLQKEGSSPEADISSEEDVSRRKKKCLEKRRRYDYTSITDEDKGEKIDFDKPSSSVPKEQSKPVVSCSKTKPQLDIPQEASKLRKRSYETSSESTDIDIGDLPKPGSSLKSDISPKAYGSPMKRKCLELRKRYDSSSTTDEDNNEKIGFEKPYPSVPKEQSKPIVSRGKTKPQLDIPQEASKLRKRSYETSSESTDIDIGDLPKPGSSIKSDISPMKRKCLEIKGRYDSSSSTDEDKDEKKGI